MTDEYAMQAPLPEHATLCAIVEGVEAETGDAFFRSPAQHLAVAFGCRYAFVTELRRETASFRTRAV